MENQKIENKIKMGETMKLKEKVIGYFQTYWKKNIFTKSVSVLVAACFILNIFNLPAFAEDPLYKKIKDQETKISVYAEDVDGSVSVAQNRDKIVLVHDGVIYEKKDKKSSGYSEHAELERKISEGKISESDLNNKLVKEYTPVGNWDGKEVTNVTRMGAKQEYKRIIEAKLAASGVTAAKKETSVGFFEGTIEKVKDFVTGFNKGSEEDQTKDGSVTDDKVNDGEQKEESVAESKASEKDQKKESVAEDKVSKEESLTELVTKDENATESEEKTEDKYEYDQGMLEDLANKTGKTTDEIEKMLEEARKDSHATDLEQGIEQGTTFDKAMSVLKDFLANGGQVVNCAAEALSTVLNMTNKGLLGFQAILADVSAGLFTKDKIDGDQVLTSASAIKSVMHSYGRTSAEGYGLGLEEFMSGLGEGESGILWVDGDHFITVSKDEEGNFNVIDPNRNNGEAEVYSASEFEKLLSGEEAETVDGKKTEGYQLERDAEGNVLVKTVTDSYGVKEAAGKDGVLSDKEMSEITGAKLVPQTVTVTKTGTRTETRTGTRTETRTGTREVTSTDEDGNTTTTTEEYEYEVEVEYQYEVEVEYTYEVEETIMVEVPDDDEKEQEKSETQKAAEEAKLRAEKEAEEAKIKAEKERLEAEIAARNAEREEQARKDALEGKNTIKDENGQEIKKEITKERAEEIKEEQDKKEKELQKEVEKKEEDLKKATEEQQSKEKFLETITPLTDAIVEEEKAKSNLTALTGGDEKELEAAKQAYITAAEKTGAIADKTIADLKASGNKEEANKFEKMTMEGVVYGGHPQKDYTKPNNGLIAQAKKTDAQVNVYVIESDKAIQALKDSVTGKPEDVENIKTQSEKAVLAAEAALEAMANSGNGDKTNKFIESVKEQIGHKENRGYMAQKSVEEYIKEGTEVYLVENKLKAAIEQVKTGENPDWTNLKTTFKEYNDAALKFTHNKEIVDEKLNGVLEAINAEGVSIRDKNGQRKDNDKIINEGIGIYYKEKDLIASEAKIGEQEKKFNESEKAWTEAITKYINGDITDAEYEAAKNNRDLERNALQAVIDEVDAKADVLKKAQENAGYDSASIEDSKKEHQVSAQAKQTMANLDANANNLAANEIMSASNDYAAAAEKLSQQNFNDITEAQNKYLRALNVLAQTTETFNKTIDKNYEEDFAKSKKEQQSAAVGKTIEEAHTKVAESVEKSVLSANTLLKDPSITDVVKEQAKNVLNFIASSGVQMFETLTNTAIKLQGEISNRVRAVANRASLSSQGIIVDTKTGTITQTQHSLNFDENDQINVYGDRTINFDASKLSLDAYNTFANAVAEGGLEAGADYLKMQQMFKSETLTDKSGNQIYTDSYIKGDATTAVLTRTYADGKTDVVIEGFDILGNRKSTQQIFATTALKEGEQASAVNLKNLDFTLDGLNLTYLKQATSYENITDKDGNKFKNAVTAYFGADGKPIGGTETIYDSNGVAVNKSGVSIGAEALTPNFIEIQKLLSEIQNAKPETQEDVDALNKKIEKLNSLIGVDEEEEKGETAKEGEDTEAAEEESFETQSNHFQKYYDILTKIGDQKVEKEGVYDGFAYFQDGGIDLTKLTYYNQGQSADENYAYKWTKVNDEFAFVLTSDFTVEDHKVLTKEGANVKLEAGKYSIEGTVSAKTEDWGNLKNINTDPQSAYIAETFGKQTVATYNGVTFDKEKGFSGGDFSDSKKNSILTDEGYTTGVQVNQSTGEIVIDQDAKKRTLNYSASLVRAEYDYEAAKANNETKEKISQTERNLINVIFKENGLTDAKAKDLGFESVDSLKSQGALAGNRAEGYYFQVEKTLTDKERKDKIAQLASLNKEFTSIEGFDDAIRTVTQITTASTLQTLMSVDEPKDSAFFMVKSKDENGKEVNGYLLDVVLTFDNNDKLAMYDYFYVPEKQAEEPKVGSIRDVLAPVIKSKVETRTTIKDGEAVQYEVVVDYVTYENKRERVTAEDKNRTEEEQKAFDEAETAKFYADKAILENEVAKNNLQYEKEAREAAIKGENLLKDSKGNILTKKVTSEAVLKEEASFKERISKLETNIVNTTILAQASLQMSLEKASKVEEIAKAKFETAKDADKTAADKEYQDLKAKTEKERTMLEKLTGDFMNLGGNSEQYKDVDKGLVNKAITYLSNVIKNGGSVVNCATDALSNVLGEGVSKAATAMQAVAIDIASGAFFTNNQVDDKNASQVMISMDAMSQILKEKGKYNGYAVKGTDGVLEGLKNGDIILNVKMKDENGAEKGHYITVSSDKDGNIIIKDVNKEAVTLSKEQIDAYSSEGKDLLSSYLKGVYNWESGSMLAMGDLKNATKMELKDLQSTSGAGLWNKAKNAVKKATNTVKNTAKKVTNTVKNTAKKAVNTVKNTAKKAVNTVKNTAKKAVNTVKNTAKKAVNTVKNTAKKAVNTVKNSVKKVANTVKNTVKKVANTVKNTVKKVANTVKNTVKKVANTVKNTVKKVANTVKNTVKKVANTVKNTVKKVANTVKNTVKKVANTVKNTVKKVANTVKNTVKKVANTVKNTVKKVANTVKNTVKKVANTVKNTVKKVANTVKNTVKKVASTVKNTVKSAINTVKNTVKNIANKVVNTVKNGINTAKNVVQKIGNGIKAGFAKAGQVFTSAVNGIKAIPGKVVAAGKTLVNGAVGIYQGIRQEFNNIGDVFKSGRELRAKEVKLDEMTKNYPQDAKNAATDYAEGRITKEEFVKRLGDNSVTRDEALKLADEIDTDKVNYRGKKDELSWFGKGVVSLFGPRVSEGETKPVTIAALEQADKDIQAHGIKIHSDSSEAYKGDLDNASNITAPQLKGSQEKYTRSIDILNLLTDKTNQGLDRYYPPQVAATKKQANTEEVAAKVLSVQEGVNTSLEGAVKSVHDKMSAGTVAAPALKQLGEVWDVIGQAGVPMATALTDFSVKLTTDKLKGSFENVKNTAILASQGIVVKGNEVNHYAFNGDQQKGVPTKGVPTTRTIVMNGEQKNNDIKALMVKDGFGAGIDYVKANGYYSSEKFLENNEEKYSAKLAGYNPGDSSKDIPPQIAIEYTFAGDYTDDIYFTGAKKGDHKILTESFDANSNVTMGVVYNTIPVPDKEDEKYVGKYTTNSGLEIKLPSAMLGDVERVTGWTKNNDGSMTADSVEFKDGEPSAFETAQVLYKDGTRIVLGERSDLRDAIITPGSKSQSSGSGSSEPTIVDKYATILKSTESLKIEGRDYKVFDLVSNDHIDASKIQTLQFGTGRAPALVSSYVDAKTGQTVVIRAEASIVNGKQVGILYDEALGWRDSWKLGTGDRSNGIVVAYDSAGRPIVEAKGITFTNENNIRDYALKNDGESIKYYEYGEKTVSGNETKEVTFSTRNVKVGNINDITSVTGSFAIPSKNSVIETITEKDTAGDIVRTKTVEIENVTITDGKYNPNEEISNRYFREYNASNELVFAKDSYAKDATISPGVVAREYGSSVVDPTSDQDYIKLSERTDFEWTVDPNGSGLILKNDVAVNGTFFHNQQGANGPEVVSGKLVDGVFKAGPSGQALLHGEVEIGAKAFEISKAAPASSGQDGTPPSNKTPDSKTNAVVVESEKAYSVSDGVLSIRDGVFVVMGNGSQFKTGSDIIGLGKIKEGYAVFDGTLDENGNRVFKAGSSGVLKVEGSNGVNYSIDTEGVRTQLFKKEDSNLLTNDKQKIVEVNGKQYIVNVDDGKDKAGGWFGIGSDNDVNIDGKWYDESKLQEIVEINDAEGNGTGVYIGVYKNQMVDGDKAGWSAEDDIKVSVGGKTYAVDVDGRLTAAALPKDIKATVSSQYINNGEEFEISLSDFRGGASDKFRPVNIGEDSTIYVPTSALAGKSEHFTVTTSDGSKVEITMKHQAYGSSEITIKGNGINYTNATKGQIYDEAGNEYSYTTIDNLLNGKKHTLLSGKNNSQSLAIEFNKEGSIVLHQGHGDVIDNVTKYEYSANGAGKLTYFTDFEKDSQGQNRFTMDVRAWDKDNKTVMTENMSAIWSGKMSEVGRAKDLTITEDRPGSRTYYASDGSINSHTEFYGKLTNIQYEKSSIKSFKPENYTEITTRSDGSVEKVTYNGYASDSKITYKVIDNVSYLEDITSVTKTTQTGKRSILNGEAAQGKSISERLGAIEYSGGSKIEDIKVLDQTVKKINVTYTDPKTGQDTTAKAITTTTHKQVIETTIKNSNNSEVRTRSELETPEVRSIVFDKQNRIIMETQDGGVHKITALNSVEGMNGSDGIKEGQILSHGKTDKIVSYNYDDKGSVEINSVEHKYNYLVDPVYVKAFGDAAANGTVEVVISNKKGNIISTETVESMVFGLDNNENVDLRKMNTDAKFAHDISFSQTLSFQDKDIPAKAFTSKKEMLNFIDTLGDEELSSVAQNMTEDQIRLMLTCDNYTIYSSKADLIAKTVNVDIHSATTSEYGVDGRVTKKITSGENYQYELAGNFAVTDISKVKNLNFTAYGLSTSKVTVDNAGFALAENSLKANSMIRTDILNGTNNILGALQSHSVYERVETNFVYDNLGRAVSNDFTETVNGQKYQGSIETKYTNNGPNAMVTSVTTINKSVVDKNGNVVSSLKPQVQDMVSVSHSHLGKADIMDLNLTAVNMYDDIGFARDSQIYKRDELRNTIIAAAVTTVYVAASVALAVVTFGSSALIQLSVTTALAAAAALAAIPSVYLGMKRGMDAVSVGDTQKAAMEFAFVALDFALLAGAWVQGIRFTNAFKAAGNTVHAGMATSEEMGKYSAHKAVKAAEAAVNANKAKAASRLAKAKQLLPNKVVRVDRYLMPLGKTLADSGSNAFVRGVGTLLQSKAVNIAASLGVSLGRNIVTANIIEGVINRLGGSELTDTSLFKALKTIYIASFMFDKDIANLAKADDVVEAGLDRALKTAQEAKELGIYPERITFKSISEAAGELSSIVREGYAKNGIRGGLSAYGNFVKEGFVNSFKNFWTHTLGSGQGVFSNTFLNSADNFLATSLKHTPDMMSNIAKFQLILNGVGGAINTQLYESLGVTFGDLVGLEVFNNIPVFTSLEDMAEQMAGMTANTLTSKEMIIFSFATPLLTTVVSPILNSIPGLGAVSRAMNKYGEKFETGSRNFASTFYEENIKEELLGNVFAWVPNQGLREMLQECFDGTPGGSFDMSMVNGLNTANAQMKMSPMETITSRDTTQAQKVQAANDLMAMTNAMGGSAANVDGLISAIVLNGAQPLSVNDVAGYMSSRTGLSVDAVMKVGSQSQVDVLRNSSSQTERSAAAQRIAERAGLSGEYLTNAVNRLSDSATIADNSIEATLAAQIAAQKYYNGSEQKKKLSDEQIKRVEAIAESYASKLSLGELSYVVSNGAAPLVEMFDNINTEYGGYENIDFKSMKNAELRSFFATMSNTQLSDFIEAMGMQLQVVPFSPLSNYKALNAATNELSRSGDFRSSVSKQIESIVDDTRKANEGKTEIEINEAVIAKLNDYKKASEGTPLRERGIIETFVNRTVEGLTSQNLMLQNASQGDPVVKQISKDLQNVLSADMTQQQEQAKKLVNDSERFDRMMKEVGAFDKVQSERLNELADKINRGGELTASDADAVQDLFVLEATVAISDVLKGQMYDAIVTKVGEVDPKAAQRFEELAKMIKDGKGSTEYEKEIDSYETKYSIPFAPIAAINGFREGQMAAFEHIVKATIVDRQQPNIKGYCEQLQTAGGKSLIGAFALEFLKSLPDVDLSGKMITWLTNEDGNVGDLSKHAEFIFGENFGGVLDQAKIDDLQNSSQKEEGALRKAFEKASIAIMTYSTWSSLFSSSMATLLAYSSDASQDVKDIAEHNRAILKAAGIELTLTEKNGETKVQFKDSTQAREAIDILLQKGQGLEKTDIPLEKISMMVGDEFDYAYTIPASALASAAGTYSSTSQFVDYYNYLLKAVNNKEALTKEQQEALAAKYGIFGISTEQIRADMQLSVPQLEAKLGLYSDISSEIKDITNNGQSKINTAEREKLISKYSSDQRAIDIVEGSIEKVIDAQIESMRMLNVYGQLLDGIEIDGKKYTIAGLVAARAEDKGGYGINKNNLVSSEAIESASARDEQMKDTLTEDEIKRGETHKTVKMEEVLNPIVDATVGRELATERQETDSQVEKFKSDEEFNKVVDAMCDRIMEQNPGLFNSKTDIKETILTGMSAYEMFALKEAELGTGGYIVDTDPISGKKVVKITNNGKAVDNLNMPGMWAIEMAEGCKDISKPSIETFISSKEAIAAFEWSIGFSGTFSEAVKGIVKDLQFAEIGGTKAGALNLGVTSALVRDQSNIADVIFNTHKGFNEKGAASVEFILTPNSDITESMVRQLRDKGVSAEQIASLSVKNLDSDLDRFAKDAKNHSNASYRNAVKEVIGDKDISKMSLQEKLSMMTELVKVKVKAGLATYIVLDVDNGGRGLNFSNMKGAFDSIKALNDVKVQDGVRQQQKIQATLWAVNFEKMDATQYEQALGRLDHRGVKVSRFNDAFYHRDIVQITSVESTRENKVIRDAVGGGDYSIDAILKALPDVQYQNEQDKLAKAGNVSMTSQYSASREKVTPISRQQAQSIFESYGFSAQSASNAVETIISQVNKGKADTGMSDLTEKETIAVENYAKFLSMSKGLISDYDPVKFNDYYMSEAAARNDIINGDVSKSLESIKTSGFTTTEQFDKLSNAVAKVETEYPAALENYQDIVSGMNEKEQALLQTAQEGGKLGFFDSRTLNKTGITQAAEELNRIAQSFEEVSQNSGLVLDRSSGEVGYGKLVLPAAQPSTVPSTDIEFAGEDIGSTIDVIDQLPESLKPVNAGATAAVETVTNIASPATELITDTFVSPVISAENGAELTNGEICLVTATDAINKVLSPISIADALLSPESVTEKTPADTLAAAGLNEENALPMGILNILEMEGVVILPEELSGIDFESVGSEGMIAYLNKGTEIGHAVAVVGISEGMVTYIDKVDGETVKETISMDEFKKLGYEGLAWVDAKTQKGYDLKNQEVDVKGTVVTELFGEKMGSIIVNGLMKAQEIDKGLMYVLNIWSDVKAMSERLEVGLEDVRNDNLLDITKKDGITIGENKINEGYVNATLEVYDALQNKKLSVGEAEVEIILLSTVRDLLIMVNKGGEKQGSMIAMLNDQDLTEKKVDIIKAQLKISKAVNSKSAIKLLKDKLEPLAEVKAKEFGDAIKELKKEIEKEEKISVREKLVALATGDKKMIDNILPGLGSDTWVDRGARGKMMSPMMTRALAASA